MVRFYYLVTLDSFCATLLRRREVIGRARRTSGMHRQGQSGFENKVICGGSVLFLQPMICTVLFIFNKLKHERPTLS